MSSTLNNLKTEVVMTAFWHHDAQLITLAKVNGVYELVNRHPSSLSLVTML